MTKWTVNHFSFVQFSQEVNDPAKNDAAATVDQATLDAVWDLGALSLQVPAGKKWQIFIN